MHIHVVITGQKANYRVAYATGRVFSLEESVTLCTTKMESWKTAQKITVA